MRELKTKKQLQKIKIFFKLCETLNSKKQLQQMQIYF